MAAAASKPKLLVIVGPTASGKSELAMKVAKKSNGEIIAADSLTIYKKMDIGTAKPSKKDQKQIKHWGLDLIGPRQRFTAAKFKKYAEAAIKDIQKRGRLPIVVGGTGLYVDSLVFGFSFAGAPDRTRRYKLEKMSAGQLQAKIKKLGYPMPLNASNKRHLIRTIERQGQTGSKQKNLEKGVVMVGIMPEPESQKRRISQRVDKMFDDGLEEETKRLVKTYKTSGLMTKAKVAYGPVIEYLAGNYAKDIAKERLATAHWQFARRQKTWFKRNRFIKWFSSADEAYKFIVKSI